MIVLKSRREIELLREAGRVVAEVGEALRPLIAPGITTAELDRLAEEITRGRGAEPAFKGYHGFPGSICASMNDEVVHGIPGPRRLAEGDIVSVDLGALLGGFYGDMAFTVAIGEVPQGVLRLLQVTQEALALAIRKAVPGNHLGDVSHAVQSHVEANGFSVVRDYAGHGIGRRMHEDPQIPNFGPPGMGPELRAGMTLAIEPMVNSGSYEVKLDADGWTVRTVDGGLSAHFEHTIAVLPDGPEILTRL